MACKQACPTHFERCNPGRRVVLKLQLELQDKNAQSTRVIKSWAICLQCSSFAAYCGRSSHHKARCSHVNIKWLLRFGQPHLSRSRFVVIIIIKAKDHHHYESTTKANDRKSKMVANGCGIFDNTWDLLIIHFSFPIIFLCHYLRSCQNTIFSPLVGRYLKKNFNNSSLTCCVDG